jgi:hypothetical protein
MPAKGHFKQFLYKLAEDPEALQKYKKNPRSYMREIGLPELEVEAVMAGNLTDIRQILHDDNGNGTNVVVVVVVAETTRM